MRVGYVKMDSSGNTTCFVLEPLPRRLHPVVATEIMKTSSLAAEQVGFVEPPTIPGAIARLQMMGGEFCGNATRAFALFLAERQYPGVYPQGNASHLVVPVEVSGHEGLILAEIIHYTDFLRKAIVKVQMPAPCLTKKAQLPGIDNSIDIIAFEGITHIVLWNVEPSEDIIDLIKTALVEDLENVPCWGAMFYNETANFVTPAVYVKQTDSLVWEGSCGSGTVAVGAALAMRKQGSVNCLLTQPAGAIQVDIIWDEKVISAGIQGEVCYKSEGIVYLDSGLC